MADPLIVESIKTTVIPGAVALSTGIASRHLPVRIRAAAAALGLTLAYAVAHGGIAGWPGFPPSEALHWTPWLAASGVIVASLGRRRAAATALTLVAVGLVWALPARLRGFYGWGPIEAGIWLAGTAAAVLLFWSPISTRAVRRVLMPGTLGIVALGTAAVSILSHSAKLAELCAALGFALAGWTGLLWWSVRRDQVGAGVLAGGASTSGGICLAALLVYTQHYVEVPPAEVMLLAAGWLTVWLSRVGPFARLPVRWGIVTHALLAALPAAAAIYLAYRRGLSVAADPYSGY